nr:hypothetical protein [Tanacetum cinerariifolium]
MDMTIDQQVALDEALVVYDVLRLTPFYKAFLVTADVPEIYMQEFWATTTHHHHLILFKMNNKKRIVNLEYFREMLHICPRIPNQKFDELSFEEEILAFLRYLGHIINKCLSGKSTRYDSPRFSQAQILCGMYHKKNVDFSYYLWEDFVYQVEHKDAKKSNEMYYPRFTKVIINFFMTKGPSILKRNKVNWHYVRDDQIFTTIKLVSRHQNTQQFGAMLPVELTNEDIRNSAAYKEYYAIALGAATPKTKASVRKTQSSFDTTMPPPTATGTRLSTSAIGKQPAKSTKAKGLSVLSEVALTEAEQINIDPPAPEVIVPLAKVIPPEHAESTGSPSSTTVDHDAPLPSKSQTTTETQPPVIPNDVEEDNHDIEVAHMGNDQLFGMPIPEVASDQSSSTISSHTIVHPDHQIPQQNSK